MGALITVIIFMLFLCLGVEAVYFITELPEMIREFREWRRWKKAHKFYGECRRSHKHKIFYL